MPTHPTVPHVSIPFTALAERILDGIKSGVDRQWYYSKELLRIKPEYLLTVSVADKLMRGLDIHTRIALEETTGDIVFAIRMSTLGFRDYFSHQTLWSGRRGKVDILLSRTTATSGFKLSELCVIELKNLDPSKVEIVKDIDRLVAFLLLQPAGSPMNVGYLAFPSTTAWKERLEAVASERAPIGIDVIVVDESVVTGEDPEDGIPAFHANVLALSRTRA